MCTRTGVTSWFISACTVVPVTGLWQERQDLHNFYFVSEIAMVSADPPKRAVYKPGGNNCHDRPRRSIAATYKRLDFHKTCGGWRYGATNSQRPCASIYTFSACAVLHHKLSIPYFALLVCLSIPRISTCVPASFTLLEPLAPVSIKSF